MKNNKNLYSIKPFLGHKNYSINSSFRSPIYMSLYNKMNISKKPKPKENPPTILDDINNQINYKLFSCYNAFKYIFKRFYNNLGFYFGFIGIISSILGIIVFLCFSKGRLTKEIFSGCKSIPNSNKKKELSKYNKNNIINSPNNQKKDSKFFYQKGKENNSGNKSADSQKNNFSENNKLSPQIEEISEKSENEENKLTNFSIIKENQFELLCQEKISNTNKDINSNMKKEAELLQIIKRTEKEKGVILEDLQKILERIRKRKEKLVNTKRANTERIKNLKQN